MSVFKADVLQGRVVLVTGGGTGICKGIAMAYAAHGAKLCITSRKQEVIDATAAEIREQTGAEVLALTSDVRDIESLAKVVAATVENFGKLDTLVNGAAGNFLAPAVTLSSNAFRTVLEIDTQGTFNAAKACHESLLASGDGLILNISATLHYRGTPMQVHACAAKAGVDAITRTLAVEWGPTIRVVGIAPGPIGDTEGMRRLAPPDVQERIAKQIPLRRCGLVHEIADAAIFLRSDAAKYITGTILVVDGGESVYSNFMGSM